MMIMTVSYFSGNCPVKRVWGYTPYVRRSLANKMQPWQFDRRATGHGAEIRVQPTKQGKIMTKNVDLPTKLQIYPPKKLDFTSNLQLPPTVTGSATVVPGVSTTTINRTEGYFHWNPKTWCFSLSGWRFQHFFSTFCRTLWLTTGTARPPAGNVEVGSPMRRIPWAKVTCGKTNGLRSKSSIYGGVSRSRNSTQQWKLTTCSLCSLTDLIRKKRCFMSSSGDFDLPLTHEKWEASSSDEKLDMGSDP